MLHAKFQNHRPSGSEEEDVLKVLAIYSHGGHLGHVTLTFYIKFHSPYLMMLHIKFGFNWLSGFREDVSYYGHIHVYNPGARTDNRMGSCFHNYKPSVHLHTPSKSPHLITFYLFSPLKCISDLS